MKHWNLLSQEEKIDRLAMTAAIGWFWALIVTGFVFALMIKWLA